MFFFPLIAFAEDFTVLDLMKRLNKFLINPILTLVFILAMLYFLYGVFKYIKGGGNPKDRETGGTHIMYGLIGMTIMFGVYVIMNILLRTVGIDETQINPETGVVNVPDLSQEFNVQIDSSQ